MQVLTVSKFSDLQIDDTVVISYAPGMMGTCRVLNVYEDHVFVMPEHGEPNAYHSMWIGKAHAFILRDITRITSVYRDSGWDT